jgi:hypothetical protein
MKVRNDEGFLFPTSQYDFRGGLHGLGRISDDRIPMVQTRLGLQPLYMSSDQIAGLSAEYPDLPVDSNGDLLRSTFLKFFIAKKFPNPTSDYDKKARSEYEGIIADLLAYEASPQAATAAAAAAAPLRDALSQVEQYALAVNGANYDVRSLAQGLRQQGDSVGARALENTGAEFVAKANQALADAKAQAAAGNLAAVQQLAQVAAALMADIRRAVQVADGQVAATAAEAERSRQAAAAVAAADAAEIARLNKAAAETAAAQQAAAQQAAAVQTASQADVAARKTVSFSLDADAEGTMFLIGKRADGTTYVVSTGAGNIDEYLKRNTNQTRFDLAQTASYVKAEKADAAVAAAAASTHKAAVDTSTATVQHTDTASGTTSTVNAATGAVTVTTPSGATVTGAGTVNAGGVITTVDTKTGTVTTQNTATGVVTQTNAATGQTVTAVQTTGTAATGGTFMTPDGKTVTTTQSITATGVDSGKLALFGLLGVLLLRGVFK